ncbi:MAG: response regulator, partial [Calditrichota bacterium]
EFALLAVTDNGQGMTPEIRAKIFEPFFTTKEIGRGTGLGLATVYGIIKQSGGNIWVYSEPDRGTTFKVYLPRTISEKSISAPIADSAYGDVTGQETVLVVEDEDAVREMAVRVLKMHGYRVVEARNGKDALELCQEMNRPFDIVVTDVVMPIMGGAELISQLQKLWKSVKYLYMSGYTSNVVVHDSILAEGVPYLQKPFRPLTLVRKVRDILDKK